MNARIGNDDAFWYNTGTVSWAKSGGDALLAIQPSESIRVNVLTFNNGFTWIYPQP